MKKILLFFLIFCNFGTNILAANPKKIGALNGNDWNKWQKATKVTFVTGFVSGSEWVAANSMLSKSAFQSTQSFSKAEILWNEVVNKFGKANAESTKNIKKYSPQEIMLYSLYDAYKKNDLYKKAIIKVGNYDIVNELNKLYTEPSNLNILLNNAIYLVCKILKGEPAEDINKILPYLRGEKQVPFGWILPLYDKNGKFLKVIEFP